MLSSGMQRRIIVPSINPLCLYEEQQDNGDPAMVTRLNRYESTVRGRLVASHSKQADITSFFTRKDS